MAAYPKLTYLLCSTSAEGEALRRTLGCPPDEIEVHEAAIVGNSDRYRFTASVCIGMFQKRLRITQELDYEFVAGGMWRRSLGFFVMLI
jgi:hypothetical protein